MPGTEHLDQKAPSMALDRARAPNLDLAPLFEGNAAARDELEIMSVLSLFQTVLVSVCFSLILCNQPVPFSESR